MEIDTKLAPGGPYYLWAFGAPGVGWVLYSAGSKAQVKTAARDAYNYGVYSRLLCFGPKGQVRLRPMPDTPTEFTPEELSF